MSRQAYIEFLQLQVDLAAIDPITPALNDQWLFIWGSQKYSSSKYYQNQFRALQSQKSIVWIRKTKCFPKIKFFAWLLLNDRLNTRNILRRRKKFLEEGYNCALCQDGVEETFNHLFFECPAAMSRWCSLGITWIDDPSRHQRLYAAIQSFGRPFFFVEIFLIGAWCLWKERNDYIFNNKAPSLTSWKNAFKAEVRTHLIRVKQSLHQPILRFLEPI